MNHGHVLQEALRFHQCGNLPRAESLYRQVLRCHPDEAETLNLLGVCRLQQADPAGAVSLLRKAVERSPNNAGWLANLAQAQLQLGEAEAALALLDRAITLQPDLSLLHLLRGDALMALGRAGVALKAYDRALDINPLLFAAHNNRGNALLTVGDAASALKAFDHALHLQPTHPATHSGRAAALLALNRRDEALSACSSALQLDPENSEAWFTRGNALLDLQQLEDAEQALRHVLAMCPTHLRARHNLGLALQLQRKYAEASEQFEQLLAEQPDYPYVPGHLLASRLHACDWRDLSSFQNQLSQSIRAGRPSADPFTLLSICDDPALQRLCAKSYVAADPALTPREFDHTIQHPVRARDSRIHLAYVSADFHDHATSRLLAELIERHDRRRFLVTGVSTGRNDHSAMRARLSRGFDRFIDAEQIDDAQLASQLRGIGIDMAIDLKGHTSGSRLGLFSRRIAPVQVAYLGYPGTTAAPFIDYLIADQIVIPAQARAHFTEHIVWLPGCYQVNDSQRPRPSALVSRTQVGLPNDAFVYCCFNNSYKILPPVFDVWMRLLARNTGSVLWLLEDNAEARRNLQQEALHRGVDPSRLVFAPRLPLPEHMARHALADLFLDTVPVNAHTTASDALWAGLPLLTCAGRGFAARVAASLLHAAGLQDLVARDLDDYEDIAASLAKDPMRLASYRTTLAEAASDSLLFNTEHFRRCIEAAYVQIWDRFTRGGAPANLSVSHPDLD